MYKYDYVDMVGGLLLLLVGSVVSYVSITFYPLGTVQRMGAGMFPAGLGVVLACLGLLLVIQSLSRQGGAPDIRLISPLFVLGGIIAFALTIIPFGLVPAILAILIITSIANIKVHPVSLALLCLLLSLLAPFVFVYLLELKIPLIRWPF